MKSVGQAHMAKIRSAEEIPLLIYSVSVLYLAP